MSFTFTIDDEAEKKYLKWLEEHKKVCKVTDVGAIGGKYTYSFTQTGLGCIHILKCVCGEKANFTEYDEW